MLTKAKQVFSKAIFELKKIKHIIQDSNREWIIVIAIIYIDGTTLSLGLIY